VTMAGLWILGWLAQRLELTFSEPGSIFAAHRMSVVVICYFVSHAAATALCPDCSKHFMFNSYLQPMWTSRQERHHPLRQMVVPLPQTAQTAWRSIPMAFPGAIP
jgi:hypothetical protein